MFRKVLTVLFASLFVVGILVADEFELTPWSWTSLKYHCPTWVSINLVNNGSYDYNTFSSVIKFDESEVSISHDSINSFFSTMPTGYIEGDLYKAAWWNVNGGNWDIFAANFILNTVPSVTALFTELNFVDDNWDAVLVFNTEDTDDGLTITSTETPGDTLTEITNATYNFEAYPCFDDWQAPVIKAWAWLDQYSPMAIEGGRLTGIQNISILVLDWINTNGHYWYQWLTKTLANYVPVPSDVDNQYGVDSSTLNVKIDNAANGGTIEYPSIITTAYTGNFTPNEYTWDIEDRWYWIDFSNSNSFEVEQQVTITVTGYDNPNYSSDTHLMTETFTFNTPTNPTISMVNPIDGATFQSTSLSPLVFNTSDAWAGVDTWSIKIEIPTIMSGGTQLMTGYIYSGSDLTFVLNNGFEGTGNEWGYQVSLVPKWDFPENKTITISWFVSDLVWNSVNGSWDFTTRPSCNFYGCNEILDVYIMWWLSTGVYPFTWELLIVTWTNPNSPYPYLTWTNDNILMCGSSRSWAELTWSITIYDRDGTTPINGNTYTWNVLYITWADFTYDNWVITVN